MKSSSGENPQPPPPFDCEQSSPLHTHTFIVHTKNYIPKSSMFTYEVVIT